MRPDWEKNDVESGLESPDKAANPARQPPVMSVHSPESPKSTEEPELYVAELVDVGGPKFSVPAKRSPSGKKSRSRAFVTGSIRITGVVLKSLFGLASMIVGLSVIATIPILQLASLGYLLALSVRVAESGKLRSGFQDLTAWANVGGAIFATWLLMLPLRGLAGMRNSALLLGNAEKANGMTVVLAIATALMTVHVAWAWFRGGKFRHFLWPAPRKLIWRIRKGKMFAESRDRFFEWFQSLRVTEFLKTGFHGFVVAFAWLFVPVTLMFGSTRLPTNIGGVVSVISGLLVALVLLYLPFLQVNCARDGQLTSGFDRERVKGQFRRAPIAWWFALLTTLALALPLYLLKAELIPREAAWLPSIVFVMSILPARILTGWAVSRAEKRESDRHFVSRWTAFLVAIPVVLAYSLVVYLSQYISWYGGFSLYEQHAFMFPVPFLGG